MADAAYLGRMEKLDDSDWYFNLSLLNLLMGTAYLHEYIGKRKRDHHYYAATVLRFLRQWSASTKRRRVLSLEDRGLLPEQLSADQYMMVEVRNMTSEEEVLHVMQSLLPIYAATKVKSA